MSDRSAAVSSLTSILASLRQGQRGTFEELQACFENIESVILAFLPEPDRFDRLSEEFSRLEREYPEPDRRPPLFGLPVGVKDIYQVDGFDTHAGSWLPASALAGPEAESVSRLKAAGALVLGKTVTTEFAYFAPGPTRNPHRPDHTPGGSSSGSAAAVAAGLAPLALGTQTIGSVNRPAAFCGAVGFKPTFGRVPTAGVIPLSPSLDHLGWFTQTTVGIDEVAAVLVDGWAGIAAVGPPALGVPTGPYLDHATPEGRAHFEGSLERIAAAGLEIRRVAAMSDYEQIAKRHRLILAAEAAQVHQEWFEQYTERYHPKTAELIRAGQEIAQADLEAARAGRDKLRQELEALMEQQAIDLWITPSATGTAPKGLDSTGDPAMNLPWTHAGMPTITLPSGMSENGLPYAVQLVARWGADETLLGHAVQIEQLLDGGH